jgi:hypothetical protein
MAASLLSMAVLTPMLAQTAFNSRLVSISYEEMFRFSISASNQA